MSIFSKKIKEIRIIKNLTRFQLSELINIPVSDICTWEDTELDEETLPSVEILMKISHSLNVSVDYLLFGKIIQHNKVLLNINNFFFNLPEDLQRDILLFLNYIKWKYNIKDSNLLILYAYSCYEKSLY